MMSIWIVADKKGVYSACFSCKEYAQAYIAWRLDKFHEDLTWQEFQVDYYVKALQDQQYL